MQDLIANGKKLKLRYKENHVIITFKLILCTCNTGIRDSATEQFIGFFAIL